MTSDKMVDKYSGYTIKIINFDMSLKVMIKMEKNS